MLKVAKSSITKGRRQSFTQNTTFEGYSLTYPVKGIKRCHYAATAEKIGDYPHIAFVIDALITVLDSRDNVPFDKTVSLNEDIDVLDLEDQAGEGFIVEGSSIDLDELALKIITSSLPIKLIREDKDSLPQNGKGYRVLTEEEKKAEKDNFLKK